jgi:5'-nucleotidase
VNRLKQITHSTVVVEDGKVVSRTAENIAVRGEKNENKVIAELVRYFSENPAFLRVLATAETPFEVKEELGCLMVDAYVAETGADLSYQNAGGVRYETHEAGGFTVADVLRLDPFQNDAVELHVTGKELTEMLKSCFDNDNQRFPYVGGMTAEYAVDPATQKIKKLVLYGKDGKKLNLKKTYKVISNSYSVAVSPANRQDPGESLGVVTAKLIMDYLEHQGQVNYQGRRCLKEN